MSFVARNHPQQVAVNGARNDVDDRETPPEVFGPLHERFGFTIDVAASDHNTKLPVYYTTVEDGLQASWAFERVWCNPPYSEIRPWVEKAFHEMKYNADLIVMLLPANRTEQAWWQDLIEPARLAGEIRVEFLRGRMRFLCNGAKAIKPNERPPFGVCLVIWGLGRAECPGCGGSGYATTRDGREVGTCRTCDGHGSVGATEPKEIQRPTVKGEDMGKAALL